MVGGEDDADIDLDGVVGADGFELSFLEDSEEFELHGGGGGVDFVEEEGSVVGGEELALFVGVGSGEGALCVSEEFGFEECFGDRATGEFDVGFVCSCGCLMDSAGDE